MENGSVKTPPSTRASSTDTCEPHHRLLHSCTQCRYERTKVYVRHYTFKFSPSTAIQRYTYAYKSFMHACAPPLSLSISTNQYMRAHHHKPGTGTIHSIAHFYSFHLIPCPITTTTTSSPIVEFVFPMYSPTRLTQNHPSLSLELIDYDDAGSRPNFGDSNSLSQQRKSESETRDRLAII